MIRRLTLLLLSLCLSAAPLAAQAADTTLPEPFTLAAAM
jgi:hypothetical protein